MTMQECGTVYASVVATAAFLWNVVRDRRTASQDSAKVTVTISVICSVLSEHGPAEPIEIEMSLGSKYDLPPRLPAGEKSFRIRCTNVGRRPISLVAWITTSVTVPHQHDKSRHPFDPVRTLEESDSTIFGLRDLDELRGHTLSLSVEDTGGKEWYLSQDAFTKMKGIMLEHRM